MLKRALATALAALLLAAFLPAAASAAPAGATLTVTVGWGGKYVVSRVTPVVVTVKNDGPELSGTLELLTGTGFSVCVRRDVVLPQGTEKRFTLFVMASGIYSPKDFEVKLVSAGKTVAAAAPVSAAGIDPGAPLCGVLSDDAAAVSYMKKISMQQTGTRSWIDLKPDDIYDNADLMGSFGIIVVNNFDSSKLSDAQRASLTEWVYSGGVLVLGAGPGRESTAAPWRNLLGGMTVGGSAEASDLAEIAAFAQSKAPQAALAVSDIQGGDWTAAAESGGKPLILEKGFGRGVAFLAAFDMGDGTLGSWDGNSQLWQTLFDRYANTSATRFVPGYGIYYYGGGGMMTALQSAPGGGWTFWLFILALAVFTALVGFVSYLILRAVGRQRLMWVTVPALSVLFTGLILLLGRNTFGRQPYLFAYTATDMTGGVAMSERTLGFVAPAMGDYRLSVENGRILFPEASVDNNYYNPGTVQSKQPVATLASADLAELDFLHVNLNGSRMAQFSSFSAEPPMAVKLVYDGKNVNCSLKNATEWTVEDVAILVGGTLKQVGDLAPGEEKTVAMKLDQTPIDQGFWNAFQKLYPSMYGGNPLAADSEDRMRAGFLQEQANIIMNFGAKPAGMATTPADGLGSAFVMGWVRKPFDYEVKVNGRAVKPQTLDLLTSLAPITQDTANGLEFVKAFAELNEELTTSSGGMSKGNYVMVEAGRMAVLDFDLSGSLRLKMDQMTLETGAQQGMPAGTWNIYNWKTGAWDMTAPKLPIEADELANYIDETGLVRMKVQAGANEYVECMPFLWAQGVKK